ncbi:MAG: tetratricopeptide repeat protein [Ardenticatenaceae bacterium]|nr:tetratricopeptide repeat protein [Ardenticatenaceae bacterium]
MGQRAEAQQLLQQSLDHLQANGSPADTLFSRNYLAAVLHHSGQWDSAAKLAQESLHLATELENRYAQAIAGNILAQIAYQQKQYDQALLYGRQSLAMLERNLSRLAIVGPQ